MSHSHDSQHTQSHDETDPLADYHPHVVPVSLLLGVFGILLFLTVITVAATLIDLGPLNIWIALAIAVVKAAVVALYFMHLRYDRPFHGVILIASLFFVAIFIGLALVDSTTYKPNLMYQPAASEQP